MSAVDFIAATDFIAVVALLIAFLSTSDKVVFRCAMALVALWLVVACIIAVVRP